MFTNGCLARSSVGRILAEAFTLTNDVERGCVIMSTWIKSTQGCHILKWNQKQAPPKVLGFSWKKHYIRTGLDLPKVIAPAIHFIWDLLYENDFTEQSGYQILLQNIQRHKDSTSYIQAIPGQEKSFEHFLRKHINYFSCRYTNRSLR